DCPVGTVRSRLATGRELLRGRLERRGLAPSSGMLAAALSPEATAGPLPAALAETTARCALGTATSPTAGLVSGSVAALPRKGLRGIFLWNLKAVAIGVMAIGGGTIGLLALSQRGPTKPQPTTTAAISPGSAKPQPRDPKPAEEIEQIRPTKNPKW